MAAPNITDQERLARLRLIRSESSGSKTFWDLIERFGNAIKAVAALPDLARSSGKLRLFNPARRR